MTKPSAMPSPTPAEPVDFDALVALALREHGARRLAEAAAAYRQILDLRPDIAEAHNNLGNVLRDQGQLDEAQARYEQALVLRPALAETHNSLGNILRGQGKLDQALARYQQALALRPDLAELHYNVGCIFQSQGKLDEAVAQYERAIALKPDFATAHNNLGVVLRAQGKLDQALACYQQALALRPDYADAHSNLGNTLKQQGKLDEAMARYQQAIALRPNLAEPYNSLGNVLLTQGKLDQAVARYQQALALRPDYADAQLGLAACYLAVGDYQRGWPAYEARLRLPASAMPRSLTRWTGEPLAGRSLLLLAEQGLGDTFQFLRYTRVLKDRGARVVLACQQALGRLLTLESDRHGPDSRGFNWDELFIMGSAEELPRCDFYLPLLSAPGMLLTSASTIPSEVPYLSADPELTAQWGRELAGTGGFKIGIDWQGASGFLSDRQRSIPLAQFAPLARLPGVRLISLQKGFGSEQIATVDFPVLDLSGRLDEAAGPFMDTAAVLCNLDLVVTSDTAIAHLAGALGVRVWVALNISPDWRWLRQRDDSPWYPTMRLFRQTTFGGWPDVFERIAHAVQACRSELAASAGE
jgi:tetratricopeptide (TPR) repeat protein